MSTELIMRPGHVIGNWEEFVTNYPPHSVTLDGALNEGPGSRNGTHLNLDHHHGVDRLATQSTAQQAVRWIIGGGLTNSFRNEANEYDIKIYANDCDQDVSLAAYILQNAERLIDLNNQNSEIVKRLDELVNKAGPLDAFGGMYPYNPASPIMKQMAYIFDPYTEIRNSGDLYLRDGNETERHLEVVRQIGERVTAYAYGEGGERPLETDYEIIGGGPGWKMFTEEGKEGRIGARYAGIEAFCIPKQRIDGNYTYTVGRVSGIVPFDVPAILNYLQYKEIERAQDAGLTLPDGETWGGSDFIGGSPRMFGSQLNPQEVQRHINDYLDLASSAHTLR